MSAATMQAAFITELGPTDNIRIGRLPVPEPGPTDVLVAVEAVAVDPVDTLVRSGAFPTPVPFPFVIGRDLVGTVDTVGQGVTGFATGDRVWANSLGHGGRQGTFAQYAVVPVDRLYPLPRGADPTVTVAAAHPAVTAWLGLFVHARVGPGDTVHIGGGAGNVGDAAVRLAARAGARVIASASPADHDSVLAAGAERVVDHHAPDHLDAIAAAAPDGLDVYWDTSGHHDLAATVDLVRTGGTILLTAAGPADPVDLPVRATYTRDIRVIGFVISNASVADLSAAADGIGPRLADGTLGARIVDELPLSAAARAHRQIETGTVRGRIILRPDPPDPPAGRSST